MNLYLVTRTDDFKPGEVKSFICAAPDVLVARKMFPYFFAAAFACSDVQKWYWDENDKARAHGHGYCHFWPNELSHVEAELIGVSLHYGTGFVLGSPTTLPKQEGVDYVAQLATARHHYHMVMAKQHRDAVTLKHMTPEQAEVDYAFHMHEFDRIVKDAAYGGMSTDKKKEMRKGLDL